MVKMLTVKEVARALSVTEWTVRNWVRQGRVPGARKFGGAIRIPETFLETGLVGAAEASVSDIDYDPRDHWPTAEVADRKVTTPETINPFDGED